MEPILSILQKPRYQFQDHPNDGTQKINAADMSLSGLQGGETLTINDSVLTNNVNVGTYSTGASSI